MKKVFINSVLCMMMLVAAVVLTACGGGTPEARFEKMRSEIAGKGYTVVEFTETQKDALKSAVGMDVTSGLVATNGGEKTVIILMAEKIPDSTDTIKVAESIYEFMSSTFFGISFEHFFHSEHGGPGGQCSRDKRFTMLSNSIPVTDAISIFNQHK